VHVVSVTTREGALQEAKTLAAGVRPTFVKSTEVPGKGTWWRVYVGPFGTREEAERAAAEVKASGRDYAQVYRLARADIEAGTGREER
jgi:cell division septation protein DedD